MLFRYFTVALSAAKVALGFRDASPFVLLSTEPLHTSTLHSSQISSAASVQERVLQSLTDCAASLYILVEQPGVSVDDLRDGFPMSNMRDRVKSEEYKSVIRIPEVIGGLDMKKVAAHLSRTCGMEQMDLRTYLSSDGRPSHAVLTMSEGSLTNSRETSRESMLQIYDAMLEHRLASVLANQTSHVLIYSSVPLSGVNDDLDDQTRHHAYQMDEPLSDTAMHLDLKRDVGGVYSRQSEDPQAGLPLFEKYQFLTPAIFMGLAVTILLLIILNVGISAISGLEISYMAFSKEMGPQAQQKGKQQ